MICTIIYKTKLFYFRFIWAYTCFNASFISLSLFYSCLLNALVTFALHRNSLPARTKDFVNERTKSHGHIYMQRNRSNELWVPIESNVLNFPLNQYNEIRWSLCRWLNRKNGQFGKLFESPAKSQNAMNLMWLIINSFNFHIIHKRELER